MQVDHQLATEAVVLGVGLFGVSVHYVTLAGKGSFQYATARISYAPFNSPVPLMPELEYALVPLAPFPCEVCVGAVWESREVDIFGSDNSVLHGHAGFRVGLGRWFMRPAERE
jgi:hypothetical protein